MGMLSEQELTLEIQAIIREAVRTDPVLDRFSLRDVKRALVARFGVPDSALKEPGVKNLVRSTTTRIVEQTLAQRQSQVEGKKDGKGEGGDESEVEEHEQNRNRHPSVKQQDVPLSDYEEDVPPSDGEQNVPPSDGEQNVPPSDGEQGVSGDKSDPSLTYSPNPIEDAAPASENPSEPELERSFEEDDDEEAPPARKKGAKDDTRSRSKNEDDDQAVSKKKAVTKAQPVTQGRKKAAASNSGPRAEVARLKSFVLACGVRKRWQSYFRDHEAAAPEGEDADGAVLRRQVRVLKDLLADLGMTGRLSKEKAQRIKAERELQSELADIGVTLEPNAEGDAGTSRAADSMQKADQGEEDDRRQGRKRQALPASSDVDSEPDGEKPATPRKRAHVEPQNETPEVYRQRRAFRRALISDSDEE